MKGSNYNISGITKFKKRNSMTKSEVSNWILKRRCFVDIILISSMQSFFSSKGWGIFCSMASVREHALRLWSLYMQITSGRYQHKTETKERRRQKGEYSEGGRRADREEKRLQWGKQIKKNVRNKREQRNIEKGKGRAEEANRTEAEDTGSR